MTILAFLPDWVEPVVRYMATEGLKGTATIAAESVAASAVVGVLLGTLMTLDFKPLRAAIRLYIEVWRGLPLIVTIFVIFFVLPSADIRLTAIQASAAGLSLWGSAQVAEATRGAVQSLPREQHEAAAALGFGWVGRHVFMILPQALRRLLPPMVSLLVNVIQNSTLAGPDRSSRASVRGQDPGGTAGGPAARRPCRGARGRDLRRPDGRVLPDLVPVDTAGRVPREAPRLVEVSRPKVGCRPAAVGRREAAPRRAVLR